MLKKFFIAFMGSMAAIWASAFLLMLVFVFAIAGIIASSFTGTTVKVDKHSILHIDLSGEIAERDEPREVQDLLMNGVDGTDETFEDIMTAIKLAGNDSKIDGIFISCGGSSLGYASREELVQALKEFKSKGKWIYTYSGNYSQGDYYVASVANEIFLNPVGSIDYHGLGTVIPFFKGALDKLGIDVQVFKVGTFKSAVEPYLLTSISEPARMQTQVYLGSIWNNVCTTVADNRNITVDSLNLIANSMTMCLPADKMVDWRLATKTAYYYEVEDKMRALTDVDKKDDLKYVTPIEYLGQSKIFSNSDKGHIAVYYAFGDIVDSGKTGISAADVVPQILDLAKDDKVLGLVLRVNSGGGSAYASEQIWKAIEVFKSYSKPVYVSMGDYAASGGYYISCGADKIYADANTLTGSIGIFGLFPSAEKLMSDKLGVTVSTVETNPDATMGTFFKPLTPSQMAAMQKNVEDGYTTFTTRVAEGRKMPVDSVLRIAEGRVWDGVTAKKIGLVDEIGSLNTAIAAMAKKLKLDADKYISYPDIEHSTIEELLKASGMAGAVPSESLKVDGLTPQEVAKCLKEVKRLRAMSPIQARMEPVTLQ
jgi:protease-4